MDPAYTRTPPHPSYPAFEVTVRAPETGPDEMATGYLYVLADGEGAIRYAGSTGDMRRRESLHRTDHRDSSPLRRHLMANGGYGNGWCMHLYAVVRYDPVRCKDALTRAEDDALHALRAAGHELLNVNVARRTGAAADAQRAWRERHGQGTPDSYMASYCREWRRQRAEAAAEAAAAQAPA